MNLSRVAEQARKLDPDEFEDLLAYLRSPRPQPLWKWLELLEAREVFIEARQEKLTVEESIRRAALAVARHPRTVERWRDASWGE